MHTGTPHQEETVLDVAASLGRRRIRWSVLPTAERMERALFLSLAAVALQAVHDAEVKLGDTVSVHGLGAIGLWPSRCARLEGIQQVVAVDPDPRAGRWRAGFGATHVLDPGAEGPLALQVRDRNAGHGVDVAIEVSGSDEGLQGALAAAGLGATVVAAGFYQGGAGNLRLGEEFHHNRLSLIASMGGWGHAEPPRADVGPATRDGHGDRACSTPTASRSAGLLGRTFPFGEAPEAYAWLDEHPAAAVKVALAYGEPAP